MKIGDVVLVDESYVATVIKVGDEMVEVRSLPGWKPVVWPFIAVNVVRCRALLSGNYVETFIDTTERITFPAYLDEENLRLYFLPPEEQPVFSFLEDEAWFEAGDKRWDIEDLEMAGDGR